MSLLLFHSTDSVRKLFTDIRYSEKGSNDRVQEAAAFNFFVDYLDDCEGSKLARLIAQDYV